MKSSTNELKKQIAAQLKSICKNTFFERAEKKEHPYLVFELNELQCESGRVQYKFEVNCIGKGESYEVDTIADRTQDLFDDFSYQNDKISFYTYRGQRQTVYEEDKNIRRRKLTFELNFYSKEE